MSEIEKLYNILIDIGDWSSDNLSEWSGNREWEEFGGSWATVGDDEIEKLNSLIDAAQDTAKVMFKNTCYDVGDERIFHCSACGFGLSDVYLSDEDYLWNDDGERIEPWPPFCPNCGRKVVQP